jgi:hypothetical protein
MGPVRPQEGWKEVQWAANRAWKSAVSEEDEMFQEKLDEAYAAFANCAERAVIEATGAQVAKLGCRAKKPRAVWHSVLPEKIDEGGYPLSGVLHALRGALVQAKRVIESPKVAEDDLAILEATEMALLKDIDGGGERRWIDFATRSQTP